jgi:serine/threonine protein kinase
MSIKAAGVFHDALLGVQFLHERGWMHRDLKPTNIGLMGGPMRDPLRSVLLDIGTADYTEKPEGFLEPEPGCGGTIHYIAPERELQPYNHSIDIWAMGIIRFELMYRYHPFKFPINPWRAGKEHEKLRPEFKKKYDEAMGRLANDGERTRKSPTQGYIHRKCPMGRRTCSWSCRVNALATDASFPRSWTSHQSDAEVSAAAPGVQVRTEQP